MFNIIFSLNIQYYHFLLEGILKCGTFVNYAKEIFFLQESLEFF